MKKLKILVSLHTRENDFQLAQAAAAEESARHLGCDAEVVFADNDAVNQSTQILQAIQNSGDSRPDAILVEPVSGTAFPQVAQAACAAAIAWVVLNRPPDYIGELRRQATTPVFTVSSDHAEIGRIQGRQFAALLPNGGGVLYIERPSQSSSAQKRTSGMLETKPANVQLTRLKGQWTQESGERAVSSWLKLATSLSTAIKLVAAQDDAMAMGARNAFEKVTNQEERARWLTLPFTGCDGLPETGQKWLREGFLRATICIPPLTGMAIEILTKAIKDKKQPKENAVTVSHSVPPVQALTPR